MIFLRCLCFIFFILEFNIVKRIGASIKSFSVYFLFIMYFYFGTFIVINLLRYLWTPISLRYFEKLLLVCPYTVRKLPYI